MSDEINVSNVELNIVKEDGDATENVAPKKRGRKPLTPEEKEARAKQRLENKKAKNTTTLSLKECLDFLVGKDLSDSFIKKISDIKSVDEKQVISALIQGFINDDIKFEEKVILTVKSN